MKIDPTTLGAEERSLVDELALRIGSRVNTTWSEAYDEALERMSPAIVARRAFFSPPEPGFGRDSGGDPVLKVCPNCGKLTSEDHAGNFSLPWTCTRMEPTQPVEMPDEGPDAIDDALRMFTRIVEHGDDPPSDEEILKISDALESWACAHAQPEPAAPVGETVTVGTFQLEDLLKYADLAEVALRTGFQPPEFLFDPADRSLRQCIDAIKEQRDHWRAHAAQPAKVRE